VGNLDGDLAEADAAEERLVEEMRLLGREALQGWADVGLAAQAWGACGTSALATMGWERQNPFDPGRLPAGRAALLSSGLPAFPIGAAAGFPSPPPSRR
jgi:hypothetical protein